MSLGDIAKAPAVLMLALLAAAGLGGVFALWDELLTIDVTVETGELDAALSVEGMGDNEEDIATSMGEPDPTVKDVSSISCVLSEDGKSIDVTITNAYPSITYWCELNLENTGTIPLKVQSIEFTTDEISPVAEEFGFYDDLDLNPPDTFVVGTQLEPGDVGYDFLVIHLSNDADENSTYNATIEIQVVQWNEFTSP
ncbi:hypothetical protein [Aeropyrum camini]|uniref:Uncharacterized protein n=1 Tax=Aeropyrum camini SY1 = JCM 12091 TaxID=1198449 RepID=U3TBR2_9CREN|nr:hypothetical protein [Aeropyrum camini]BAN90977.1 hypothetical protein ACAM_1508 [Aeropyrum camini SY1 = JCM 12091]